MDFLDWEPDRKTVDLCATPARFAVVSVAGLASGNDRSASATGSTGPLLQQVRSVAELATGSTGPLLQQVGSVAEAAVLCPLPATDRTRCRSSARANLAEKMKKLNRKYAK